MAKSRPPDYEVSMRCGKQAKSYRVVGAAWDKITDDGRPYIGVSLDVPLVNVADPLTGGFGASLLLFPRVKYVGTSKRPTDDAPPESFTPSTDEDFAKDDIPFPEESPEDRR